ncbi:S100P-binding protein [Rhineura floridana]|uniref:S100P-binding protein n=1 Tax=Rhineura floridana TaxID=261503 RepID=UPI002AC8923D|nr:S100P-binding protein [Rhineura floridana]
MAAVSRSKRPFEECQEGNQPDTKRQCCAKHCYSPFVALSVPSFSSTEHFDNSDTDDSIMDDTLLDPSDADFSDSSTELTREAEDKLLSDSPSCCYLETSSDSVALKPNAEHVGSGSGLASLKLSGALNETIKTEPLSPTGPLDYSKDGIVCRNDSVNPESGSDMKMGSQNQAGLGLGSSSSLPSEAIPVAAASLGLEKGSDVSRVANKEAVRAAIGDSSQTVSQLMVKSEPTSVVAEGPSEEQSSINQNVLGGESSSSPPQEDKIGLGSSGSRGEAVPSNSNSVNDQREDHVGSPSFIELNSFVRPRNRIYIQETDLESSKEKYINDVLAHARRDEHLIGEVSELQKLISSVTAENYSQEPRYKHPTNLTVRNYARRANRTIQRCSLDQWVDRSQRNLRRFEGVPDRFKRSPIPS